MNREQAEKEILMHLRAIKKIKNEYSSEKDVLTMAIIGDYISFNNEYWEDDRGELKYHEFYEKGVSE